jgi:hypothetical protein
MPFDPDYPNGEVKKMFRPLERLSERYIEDPLAPPILTCEWMYMGAEVGKPVIYQYKHKNSRRYLCISARGRIALGTGATGKPYFTDNPHRVLAALELHEFGGTWEMEDYCDECRALLQRRRAMRHLRAV